MRHGHQASTRCTFAGLGKSIKAAPILLPFLLPDDQGMGPGWTPALGGWPSGTAPEEAPGKVWDNTATWWAARAHHGRKGSLGSISVHRILHPWLGSPGSGESPMRAAEQGQASTANSDARHRRKGRLGESMSAFLPGARGQLPAGELGNQGSKAGNGKHCRRRGFGGGGCLE